MERRGNDAQYPDLVQLNARRRVLDAVGQELLEKTVADYVAALETAMTVFEANGDYATGKRPHGWCRLMDELSRPAAGEDVAEAIASGRWSCRASCRRPALDAMKDGTPADYWCAGGLRVHGAPIVAGGEVVGSVSVGCGGPPNDEQLRTLAERFGTPLERLRREAEAIPPSTPESETMACHMADATARLLGEVIARRTAELERDRSREMYTGMIAHDLRSPLSAISVGVEGLLRSATAHELQTRSLDRIGRSARRMSRMVEDLLDLARARIGGGIPLHLRRESLAAIAAEMVDEVRLANPDQAIEIRSEGETSFDGDGDRLCEVVENLLVNAVRHGQRSPVSVEVAGERDAVVLRVRNGGPPIPADVLGTIFEPFEQGRPRAAGAQARGLGLGLHIAREFVRAHGGAIDVRSSAEEGTVFSVRLPRSAQSPPRGRDEAQADER